MKDQKCFVHYETFPTFCTVIYEASIPVLSFLLYIHGSIIKIKRSFIEHKISMGPRVQGESSTFFLFFFGGGGGPGSYKLGNTIDNDWPDNCNKTEV